MYLQIMTAYSPDDIAWWQRNCGAVFNSGKVLQHLSFKDAHILN
jgi:hypothetical protein